MLETRRQAGRVRVGNNTKKTKVQLDQEYFDLFFGTARWDKYKDELQQEKHKSKTKGSK